MTPVEIIGRSHVACQDPNLHPKILRHQKPATTFQRRCRQLNLDSSLFLNTSEPKQLPLQLFILEKQLLVHLRDFTVHIVLMFCNYSISTLNFRVLLFHCGWAKLLGEVFCDSDNDLWVQKLHEPSLRRSFGRSYRITYVDCAVDLFALLQRLSLKTLSVASPQESFIPLHHCQNWGSSSVFLQRSIYMHQLSFLPTPSASQ